MSKNKITARILAASLAVLMLLAGCSTGADSTDAARAAELEAENAALTQQVEELTAQVNELKDQVSRLQQVIAGLDVDTTDQEIADAMGDEYAEATRLYAEIQAAYTQFDRAKLEELCPQLNKLLEYLSAEQLQSYYLILEYLEQPSNG